MKYQDVLKRFVSEQAQLLQEKQMKQQLQEQMLAAKAQALSSFISGQQQSPQEEYTESEHNPFEEGQEYKAGGIHIDPSKKGTFKAQATRMGMSIQEAASHILNNRERYSPGMVKKANFAKNFAKEEGGEMYGDPPKKKFKPYMLDHDSQVQNVMTQTTSENGSNFNQGFNQYNRTIDVYKNGSPSDTSYMFTSEGQNKPFEQVYFSTQLDPVTKQPRGEKRINDKFSQLTPEERKYYQAKIMQELQRKESGGMFTGDYEYEGGGEMIRRADGSYSKRGLWDNIRDNVGSGKRPTKEMLEQERKIKRQYPDGGDITSILENTAGPRAEPMYVPESYETFINSERYVPGTNDKLINPATGLADKVYRNADDKMKIDYIDARNIDGNKKFTRQEFDKFNPIHEYYQRQLLKSSMDNYDSYKSGHLKHDINEELPDYPFLEDVVKQAHEHNMANGYDDTDKITSYIGNMAKEEGLDEYDLMNKYFNGYTDVAVARYLLEKYKKKLQK